MDHQPRPEAGLLNPRVLQDKGGFLSPVVSIVDHEGKPAILKDYRRTNAVTRKVLAPSLVKREYSVLRHLEGCPGIPKAYALVDKLQVILEYVEGKTINKFKAGELPDKVFDRFCEVVRAMHKRNVVHLDLRQPRNILIAGDRVYLIDFANAIRGRLAKQLRAVDESALLKFKRRLWPHLMTEADQKRLDSFNFVRKLWIFSPVGRKKRR